MKIVRQMLAQNENLFPGEREVIEAALDGAARFGYGNLMAWLATEWAVRLRDREGLPEESAIKAVSNRGPYQLPKKQ